MFVNLATTHWLAESYNTSSYQDSDADFVILAKVKLSLGIRVLPAPRPTTPPLTSEFLPSKPLGKDFLTSSDGIL
jgi:hypothetical protein